MFRNLYLKTVLLASLVTGGVLAHAQAYVPCVVTPNTFTNYLYMTKPGHCLLNFDLILNADLDILDSTISGIQVGLGTETARATNAEAGKQDKIPGLSSDGDSGIAVTKKISAGTVSVTGSVTAPQHCIGASCITAWPVSGAPLSALTASKQTSKRPLIPFYIDTTDFFAGSALAAPSGAASFPNGQGQVNVTGTVGSTTLTLNSFTVGVLANYGGAPWSAVILHDDGTYGVYSVSAVTSSTISIFPTLAKAVTAGSLWNLQNSVLGQHLTDIGYTAMAKWLYGLKKSDGYISEYAAISDFDSAGTVIGTALTAVNGPLPGGFISGSTIAGGIWPGSASLTGVQSGATASSDANATYFNRPLWGNYLASNVAGQGAQHVANLGGRSGYFTALVAVSGQNGATPPSLATASVVIDGKILYTKVISGLTRVKVPFFNAWSGTFQVVLNSSVTTVVSVSKIAWYTWDDSLTSSMADPLIPPGSSVAMLMDSWGVFHAGPPVGNALQLGLQSVNAADATGAWTGMLNQSVGGTCAQWGINNYSTLIQPSRPDYVIFDFAINDANGTCNGLSITAVTGPQYAANAVALTKLATANGSTPIYLRALETASAGQTQTLSGLDSALNTIPVAFTAPNPPPTNQSYPPAGVPISTGSAYGTSLPAAVGGAGYVTGPVAGTFAGRIPEWSNTTGALGDVGLHLAASGSFVLPTVIGTPAARNIPSFQDANGNLADTGITKYQIPQLVTCGATTTCSNVVVQSFGRMIWGTVTLSTGAATVSSITAFTSTSSFGCITNDVTAANYSKGVPASTTSVTFTGTGSDVLFYICTGN